MQKEVRMMKALIIKSGLQSNKTIISEEAVRKMYSEHNEGKPLFNDMRSKESSLCGYLNRTELFRNKETGELEMWGYFTYMYNGIDFSKDGKCSCKIAYSGNTNKNTVLHNCSLVCCTMINEAGDIDGKPYVETYSE